MKKSASMVRMIALLAGVGVALAGSAAMAQWGSLKGQFVFDGKAPEAAAVNVTKDQEFCGKFGLKDEKLVVNPENGGIRNVVVMLYVGRTDKNKPKVHPDLDKAGTMQVMYDNKECRFEPHVGVIWTKQKVRLGNLDEVGHNVNISTLNPGNPPLNQLIPGGKDIVHQFKAEENLPIPVACNIHPWMKGWLVIRDTPYAAVTDKDGNFAIENLPAGKWKFRFWQEEAGYLANLTLGGKKTDRRGEVEVEIKDGQATDLGVAKIAAAAFKKK